MMGNELIAGGVQLMLVGMGTVFVFLTALVGATTLMSRFAGSTMPPFPADDGPNDEELAAISAAIARHRGT